MLATLLLEHRITYLNKVIIFQDEESLSDSGIFGKLGQKARIVDIVENHGGGFPFIDVTFDFKEFVEYNLKLYSASYVHTCIETYAIDLYKKIPFRFESETIVELKKMIKTMMDVTTPYSQLNPHSLLHNPVLLYENMKEATKHCLDLIDKIEQSQN